MWADQPIREWIDDVCRQYSRMTGRALVFDSFLDCSERRPPANSLDAGAQWRTTITDGTQTVGVLRLQNRAGGKRDGAFLRACEAAELTASLIERVMTSRATTGLEAGDAAEYPPPARRSSGTSRDHVAASSLHPVDVTRRVERLLDVACRSMGYPIAALFAADHEIRQCRLRLVRAPETLQLAPEELIRCQTFLEESGVDQFGSTTVFRRNAEPIESQSWLPDELNVAVVQRVGDASETGGALWLYDRRDRRLSRRDRHILTSIAARLEPLLQHAALLDEGTQGRKLKLEMEVASRSQASLPLVYQGRNGWCELAGCLQSARGLGGDLFELIPLSHDQVFLAIGDAAGHSIPAAIVMANVRGALRALFDCSPQIDGVPYGRPPEEVLSRINSVLHGIVQAHQFMTMFCGVLDGRTLTLEYANAGHPQPLLLREGRLHRLEAHGLVLGVTDHTTYDRSFLKLQPNDFLTFYTDGVTEAACRDRHQFGAEGLEKAILSDACRNPAEMRDAIWSALQSQLRSSGQRDDRTLVVVRIAGPCIEGDQ